MIKHLFKAVRWLYRSAVTGRFISKVEAEAHPETSVKERKK